MRPGATIERLQEEVVASLSNKVYEKAFEVVAAGICSLTDKHTCSISYNSINKKENVITSINNFKSSVNNLNSIFKMTTIPPASISKQNSSPFDNVNQKKLESDITIINEHITMINSQSNVGTVRWDSDLIKISTKRRGKYNQNFKKIVKFDYTSLHDGVHAMPCLSRKWFSVLIESVKVDLASAAPLLQSDSESESESEEDRHSWDFKR